jgi:hypothetical protein
MVKKFIKGNNNFLWAGAVIGVVLIFLYVGGIREGFQNSPLSSFIKSVPPLKADTTQPVNMPLKPMPSLSTPPATPAPTPPAPPMNTNLFTPPPSVLQNAKPSIATLRTKLNELKAMVDNM